MSVTGTILAQALYIQTDAGVAVNYATKAAFTGAGWNIVWQDSDGVALTSQPTWTLSAGSGGRHVVGFENPEGQWTAKVVQIASNLSNPLEFSGEGLGADAELIYATILASGGLPATSIATDGEVRIFDSDSLRVDLTVLEAALTYVGATSLADLSSMVAEIKLITLNSDDPATVTGLTETILTDTSGARVVRVDLDAFASSLEVPDGEAETRARIDLRIVKGARQAIASTRSLVILWKALS